MEVDVAWVEISGLQYDRRWMLADEESNTFISQRSHPGLALLRCELKDHKIFIYNNEDFVSFDTNLTISGAPLNVTVWGDTVEAHEVDLAVSYWFSEILGIKCRLVKIKDNTSRKKFYGPEKSNRTYVSLADGYPALIVGSASLEELNRRCPVPIASDRFRGNIIVQTQIPHEEDEWGVLTTGNVEMEVVKPCVRCQVINIEQSTAESMLEPTKTLAQYRLSKEGIIFGANTVFHKEGMIRKGDTLIAQQRIL